MFIRAYLRASTDSQDAERSKQDLINFTESHSQRIASFYTENISGTKLERPELDKLISDSQQGDILLIEKMDRLTRLPFEVWETLKVRIKSNGIQIVVLDQPTTHNMLKGSDEATSAIQQALTSFMLDLGAAMARDDYETRMKRTKQGIEKAKAQGKYKGRPVSAETALNCERAQKLIDSGETVTAAVKAIGVSRAQYYKWVK
ncbi:MULTISPECIES: recombinase family protein [Vibrio]|uniref:recombinase family protein n=1 Tax=Vibrio TaxID=662 RepID=UPI000C8283AB|nr:MULTISPECIES: recombinase family protein [Vibrio]PMI54473.1 resolvase [Vibrio splendidus]